MIVPFPCCLHPVHITNCHLLCYFSHLHQYRCCYFFCVIVHCLLYTVKLAQIVLVCISNQDCSLCWANFMLLLGIGAVSNWGQNHHWASNPDCLEMIWGLILRNILIGNQTNGLKGLWLVTSRESSWRRSHCWTTVINISTAVVSVLGW